MSDAGPGVGTPRRTDGGRCASPDVLIVEDDANIADLYQSTLEAERYTVDVAHSTESALGKLDDQYTVVLLDRRLPDAPGAELLSAIREQELDIRVGMVTAVEPDFDIVEMGFDLYVLKPISQRDLLDAVETLETRSQYDETLQRTASLASKRAMLEAEKPPAALDASAEYQRLTDQLEELDGELEQITEQFDTEDYRRLFLDIDT